MESDGNRVDQQQPEHAGDMDENDPLIHGVRSSPRQTIARA